MMWVLSFQLVILCVVYSQAWPFAVAVYLTCYLDNSVQLLQHGRLRMSLLSGISALYYHKLLFYCSCVCKHCFFAKVKLSDIAKREYIIRLSCNVILANSQFMGHVFLHNPYDRPRYRNVCIFCHDFFLHCFVQTQGFG